MSAIKKVFEHNREVKRLRMERYLQKQSEKNKVVEIEPVEDFINEEEISQFESILHNNWFLCDEEVLEYLNSADEDTYQHIVETLDTFPERIQNVIRDNFIPRKLSDKQVTEITDHDMILRYMKNDEEWDNKIEEAWQKYIKESGISRPDGELEDTLEEKTEELDKKKKLLEQEKNKKSNTYVPPSMRNRKVEKTAEVTKLEEIVEKLENEIVKLKKQIKEKEKCWYAERKSNFALKWLTMPLVS